MQYFGFFLLFCISNIFFAVNAAGGQVPQSVWVDTDLACGSRSSVGILEAVDVDDCLALANLLNNEHFQVEGISLVFGNAPISDVIEATHRFRRYYIASYPNRPFPPIYVGAKSAWSRRFTNKATEASLAIGQHFENNTRTVLISLGPLTNIATALQQQPKISRNIEKLIWVGGTESDSRRFFPSDTRLVSFRDFNLVKDKQALEFVFSSPVILQLAGYELGSTMLLEADEINWFGIQEPLNTYLVESAAKWQFYWQHHFGIEGFYPFDLMAVHSLLENPNILCRQTTANLKHRLFTIHSLKIGTGTRNVLYCIGSRR